MRIYQLVRNTPAGDLVMGTFINHEDAIVKKINWNRNVKCSWDKAEIYDYEVEGTEGMILVPDKNEQKNS